jgi:hypothetical protein
MEEILVSEMKFDAYVTSLRKFEFWESADHLDNLRRQKRTLNA